MLNRSSIFAVAAVATVAIGALAPTSASAMRGSFAGGGSRSFGSGISHTVNISRVNTTSYRNSFARRAGSTTIVRCAFCGSPRTPILPCTAFVRCGNPPGTHLPPPIAWWPHHDHPWWITFHHPHWGVGTTLVTAPADATATSTAPCNCLTKQYLDDGSVLFQDICTKEAAMATPEELKAQAQGTASQTQAQPQTQTQ